MKNKNNLNWNEIRFFKIKEFECPCCKKVIFDKNLVFKLELARELAETPFILTSAYRCAVHNEKVGGVRGSSHVKGLAVDIACTTGEKRVNILKGLIIAGFRRIGISKTFIHVDVDLSKPNSLWLY
jgi:uncharacterized protein YcbK (DUF882 family)